MLTPLPLVVDEDVAAFSFVRIGKRSHWDLSTLLVTIRLRAAKDFTESTSVENWNFFHQIEIESLFLSSHSRKKSQNYPE